MLKELDPALGGSFGGLLENWNENKNENVKIIDKHWDGKERKN
jgi:hypothetical protein